MAFDVKVKGAINGLDRLIDDLENTPSSAQVRRMRALFRALMIAHLRREAIPAMRDATPKQSGQAARSIRAKLITKPVYGIEIGPGKKGFYLQWHPEADRIEREYKSIVEDVWSRHAAAAAREALRRVLEG